MRGSCGTMMNYMFATGMKNDEASDDSDGSLDGLNCFRNFDRLEPRDRHKWPRISQVPSRSRQPMNFLQPDRFMALCR